MLETLLNNPLKYLIVDTTYLIKIQSVLKSVSHMTVNSAIISL